MARRFVAPNFIAIFALIICSPSFAAAPLAVVELDSQRVIAQADSNQAHAEHELADWKLQQLMQLQDKGHASWQEVAEQRAAVMSLAAQARAAQQYVQAVVDWQQRLATVRRSQDFADYECVRLYMPQTTRLVAWMPTDLANFELAKQHLEGLGREHQAAIGVDLSMLETEMDSARQEVESFRFNTRDRHLFDRAKIQLRLAVAKLEIAKARKAATSILIRRMVLTRDSLRAHRDNRRSNKRSDTERESVSLAQVGTRFVDASGDHDLTKLVKAMALDQSIVEGRIAWLTHQHTAAAERVEVLEKLLQNKYANRDELDFAVQQRQDLEAQIQQVQQATRLTDFIASQYRSEDQTRPNTARVRQAGNGYDHQVTGDPNVIRHQLETTKRMLQAIAHRATIEAQQVYLVEKEKRIARIPQRLRAPKELDHIQHKVRGTQLQLELTRHEVAAIEQEKQRFERQLKTQRGEPYQLVQLDKGQFIRRDHLELVGLWISAIGAIGQVDCCDYWLGVHPYIESSMLFDFTSDLIADRPRSTPTLIRRADCWSEDVLLRRTEYSSLSERPYSTRRLSLAADWLSYRCASIRYSTYNDDPLRQCDVRYHWGPRAYLAASSLGHFRFRSCYPYSSGDWYARSPTACWRSSVMSYEFAGPPWGTFPYRRSYSFQSAFPARSILYANPYARPSTPFSGLGYTDWLNSTCFD